MKRVVGFGGMMLSSSKALLGEREWLGGFLQAISVEKRALALKITRTKEKHERGHGPPQLFAIYLFKLILY